MERKGQSKVNQKERKGNTTKSTKETENGTKPTYGDNPTARRRGQHANQQGNWWIGGYERRPSKSAPAGYGQGDGLQGTLTTPSFIIGGKYITFLIGGGCNINSVRAELIIDYEV